MRAWQSWIAKRAFISEGHQVDVPTFQRRRRKIMYELMYLAMALFLWTGAPQDNGVLGVRSANQPEQATERVTINGSGLRRGPSIEGGGIRRDRIKPSGHKLNHNETLVRDAERKP
jgi:hypothetical protein